VVCKPHGQASPEVKNGSILRLAGKDDSQHRLVPRAVRFDADSARTLFAAIPQDLCLESFVLALAIGRGDVSDVESQEGLVMSPTFPKTEVDFPLHDSCGNTFALLGKVAVAVAIDVEMILCLTRVQGIRHAVEDQPDAVSCLRAEDQETVLG